jgi:hypothetical protein
MITMTYETALDISSITRHRLAATLSYDTRNVSFPLPQISLLCMESHRRRLSLSPSLFFFILCYYLSPFVLRLIDLTSIY